MMKEIQQLKNELNAFVAQMSFHVHSGTDSQLIPFKNLSQKKLYIPHFIADGSVAANYGVIYLAPFDCVVTGFLEAHQTAGTNGGAVTLQLEKLTGTQALDAGVDILATAVNLKGAINTILQYPNTSASLLFSEVVTSFKKPYTLKKGDRIALKDAGTLTAVAGVTILLELTYT